jgi:hypothetical protein
MVSFPDIADTVMHLDVFILLCYTRISPCYRYYILEVMMIVFAGILS